MSDEAAPPIPGPTVSSGTTTVDADGEVAWTPEVGVTYSNLPMLENGVARLMTAGEAAAIQTLASTRVLIPKSTVQARTQAAGVYDAVFKLLMSQPVQFGQWFAPDWPNVYADDAGLLAMLKAVGCTDAQVATITAAP